MKKTYLAVHFTKWHFLSIFDKKVMGLVPKYYLLAGDASQVSIFFQCGSFILPLNYLLQIGLMLKINKIFKLLFTLPDLGSFQNKLVSSSFK